MNFSHFCSPHRTMSNNHMTMMNLNQSPVREQPHSPKSEKKIKPGSSKKIKSTFFNDEEFSSFSELLQKIDCDIGIYIKSQKGSR